VLGLELGIVGLDLGQGKELEIGLGFYVLCSD
jgi:hypothetical protein